MSNDVFEAVKEILSDYIDNPSVISLDTNIVMDIGLDSIVFLDVLQCLDKKVNLRTMDLINEEFEKGNDIEKYFVVSALVELIDCRLACEA